MKVIAMIFALIGLCTCSSQVQAEEYRDLARRFTVTPPAQWQRMPEKDIKALNDFAAGLSTGATMVYLAGYRKTASGPLTPPYVLIMCSDVRLKGSDYDTFEKSINAVDFSKVSKNVGEKVGENIKQIDAKQWVLDRSRNRVTMNVSMTDARGLKLQSQCTMFLGDENIIQMNCYAQEGKMAESEAEFDAFVEGFRFDPGAQFHPDTRIGDRAGAIGELVGIGIAGVVGLIVYRKFKKAPLRA